MAAGGTPTLLTHQGLTPKTPIVNDDGTPTMFFFRYMLTLAGNAQLIQDLQMLEGIDAGGDAAVARANLENLEAAHNLEILLAAPPGSAEWTRDQLALEALIAMPAPVMLPAAPLRGTLSGIPQGLNQGDAGRPYYAADFAHWYRWDGAAWNYGDGDSGSGYIEWFLVPPRAGKWQLCDGTNLVFESRADGTMALVQFPGLAAGRMPDMVTANAYLRAAAAANGAIGAAVPPVLNTADLHPQLAAAGSGGSNFVESFDNPHTHTFASAGEPAHLDAMPYYRL